MKEEILRLDRVTYMDQGVMELDHFCLDIFAGEIMGLFPINGTGLQPLMRLLRQNLPIHYGFIYYREKLVNHWQRSDNSYNRIGIIEHRSGLADDLTVADNVFVLRQGFGKRVINRDVLRRQLEPFLADIGVTIPPFAHVRDLSTFHRFVVELVKAVVAGNRLIILADAGAIVSDGELVRLHEILRHYAAQGISFLYVSQHYEEIRQICGRAAVMINGHIAKLVSAREVEPEALYHPFAPQYQSTSSIRRPPAAGAVPALEITALSHGKIEGLDLTVAPGECVVLQDLDNRIFDDLIQIVTGQVRPQEGLVRVSGRRYARGNRRDMAVIQRLATRTMLFSELSYMDNLCFTMDHRLRWLWLRAQPMASIRSEYGGWLGRDVFEMHIDQLTQTQKYDLIYARILLQRPKAVFCVQPFIQADVEQQTHIWGLLERLLEKEISVVILAVNLADTLYLADRLIQIKDGRVAAQYGPGEYGGLAGWTAGRQW